MLGAKTGGGSTEQKNQKTEGCCMLDWKASLLELKAMLNAKQFDNIIPPNIKSFKLLSNAWKADLCNIPPHESTNNLKKLLNKNK